MGIILVWLATIALSLFLSATKPVDAVLVLGGSARREIYAAELAKQFPQVPILISRGSADPCIWLIFERVQAPIDRVWLEHCAKSTFGNFYFGVPILRRWQVHKVRLVTSGSQATRAILLAQILLGAHGILVEPDVVQEIGIPGNRESFLKTSLDITRSLGWAVVSQFYSPSVNVLPLKSVDIQVWRKQKFACEHQSNVR
ncbi:YdcF family protein [Phormidesmis priestleyi]